MLTKQKINHMQKRIAESELDALFCMLSVNILALGGYWSGNQNVALLVPAYGKPIILMPETERKDVERVLDTSMVEIHSMALEDPHVMRNWFDTLLEELRTVLPACGLGDSRIGVERTYEDGACGKVFGVYKYPSERIWGRLAELFPGAAFVDGSPVIRKLRMIKTPEEKEAIRRTAVIGSMGFQKAKEYIRPGITEAELAAAERFEIMTQGCGKGGAHYTECFTSAYAGARSAEQWAYWCNATGNTIKAGDIVILELACCTDGYWCDLTRNISLGAPSQKALEIQKIVLEAQQIALAQVRPGNRAADVAKACYAYFNKKGFDENIYKHGLGHGVGFIYNEAPTLHVQDETVLEEGMVLAVEPGLYFEGEFGYRAEDIFYITKDGPELLSDYPHAFR